LALVVWGPGQSKLDLVAIDLFHGKLKQGAGKPALFSLGFTQPGINATNMNG
jgi:hypothetical protein